MEVSVKILKLNLLLVCFISFATSTSMSAFGSFGAKPQKKTWWNTIFKNRDNQKKADASEKVRKVITDAVKSMAGSPISMLNFAYVISAFVFMVRDDMRKGAESEARELEKMEDILFFRRCLTRGSLS